MGLFQRAKAKLTGESSKIKVKEEVSRALEQGIIPKNTISVTSRYFSSQQLGSEKDFQENEQQAFVSMESPDAKQKKEVTYTSLQKGGQVISSNESLHRSVNQSKKERSSQGRDQNIWKNTPIKPQGEQNIHQPTEAPSDQKARQVTAIEAGDKLQIAQTTNDKSRHKQGTTQSTDIKAGDKQQTTQTTNDKAWDTQQADQTTDFKAEDKQQVAQATDSKARDKQRTAQATDIEAEDTKQTTDTESDSKQDLAPSEPLVKYENTDYTLTLDVSSVRTLQITYQAETIYLYPSPDNHFYLKEHTGLTGVEYQAKVSANRFKTSIRHGRREELDRDRFVALFLPECFQGELLLSSQYGSILSEHSWAFERFVAETSEGNIILHTVEAPRIRLLSSLSPIQIEHAIGFLDVHSVSGSIFAQRIDGGAKLDTSSGPIFAHFTSINHQVECNTPNADMELVLPASQGIEFDGISKRGTIHCEIEECPVKIKPGNVCALYGQFNEKPYEKVKFSSINGNIWIRTE